MEVLLIRHTSVNVAPGTCYGQSDVPLAATFINEAEEAKQNLLLHGAIDKAYTSPLTRARHLAVYCGYADAEADNRLMEMNMGDWEMQRYDDISDPYIKEWYKDYLHLPTPHGESFMQQQTRVNSFLDDLSAMPFRRVAIFAHGGVLACAAVYGGLATLDTVWLHPTPYGGIIKITV